MGGEGGTAASRCFPSIFPSSSPSCQSPEHSPGISMGNDPIPIGCTALKPIERHGMDAVSWFLYDKNTGAIMGRTPLSWLLITIFYIVYYAFLAGFWALIDSSIIMFNKENEANIEG